MSRLIRHICAVCVLLAAGVLMSTSGNAAPVQAPTDPGEEGPCAITTEENVDVNGVQTDFYYPSGSQCEDGPSAPYPAIVFAHGFSMFGLANGADDNAGNGEHLAGWGYVVAIPVLPDEDPDERVAILQALLSYLETQTATPGSFLYQKIDTGRLAAVGHSYGGATVLALAARDVRVKAVVALDPVYHQGGPGGGEEPEIWDPDIEGPGITAPACILGAPDSGCNSDSDYAEIYPFVGAMHRASYRIAEASHCDFMDPGNFLCYPFCGGSANETRTRLIQKYMTAWFNYYLHLDTDAYAYLYGTEADADVAAGLIDIRHVDTAPRGVTATGSIQAVKLGWVRWEHPIVAGYNIHRRLPGEGYPGTPYAQVGPVSAYVDTGLTVGQVYSYTVCSRDSAGNPHGLSAEVSAVPLEATAWVYLPLLLRSFP